MNTTPKVRKGTDLKVGDRILVQGVITTVLRTGDTVEPDLFGRRFAAVRARREDTGAEGEMSFGPEAVYILVHGDWVVSDSEAEGVGAGGHVPILATFADDVDPDDDGIVRHEKPGYTYQPKGLMAEAWGKTGYRTRLGDRKEASFAQRRKWMDNDSGRDSLEYVRSLDDATTMAGMEWDNPVSTEICRRLNERGGRPVNHSWVTMQCANNAYDRELIDETELDRIVNE